MSIGESLVAQFDRMVRRDGGQVSLLSEDTEAIVVGYKPGADPECEDGVCILPEMELQQLMAETLARQAPSLKIVVNRIS
jgi:hypothetical protein